MVYKPETPFDNIESALEYVGFLLEATQEAQAQIQVEIAQAGNPGLTRKNQALQIVQLKLVQLHSHIKTSKRLLNDLRKLRRLILEERQATARSATA